MNDTLETTDRQTSTHTTRRQNTVKSLLNLITTHALVDIWRQIHFDKKQYTWRRQNHNEKSRIDFWLIDENIIPLVYSTDIRPACIKYTDHQDISLKLRKTNKRGPGFWKSNSMFFK